MALPRRIPIPTRPVGPIQLLSKAYFRKKVTARRSATMPTRFSQRPAMRVSRSSGAESPGGDRGWGAAAAGGCTGRGTPGDTALGIGGAVGAAGGRVVAGATGET